jgi:hypothetical protein
MMEGAFMDDGWKQLALPKKDMGKEPSDRELRAFAACSDLLSGLYRLGEYRMALEELEYCTDDFVREVADISAPSEVTQRISGKEAMAASLKNSIAAMPESEHYWRTHILTNMVWRSLSETEVECSHWQLYYDNKELLDSTSQVAEMPLAPTAIMDCIQRFRFEEDRWRLCYRRYTWAYGRVPIPKSQ